MYTIEYRLRNAQAQPFTAKLRVYLLLYTNIGRILLVIVVIVKNMYTVRYRKILAEIKENKNSRIIKLFEN